MHDCVRCSDAVNGLSSSWQAARAIVGIFRLGRTQERQRNADETKEGGLERDRGIIASRLWGTDGVTPCNFSHR